MSIEAQMKKWTEHL